MHEAIDVRAAALRAMRYLVVDEITVAAFNQVNLSFLVARSLDVVLDNKLERLQALRLARKLLSINPLAFPPALTRSLISISRDGLQERDILTRSCWAALSELTLLNPRELTNTGGFSAIFSNVLLGNQSPQISEAMVSCILYQLNYPKTRSQLKDQDLQFFLSSFTECYTSSPRSLEIESTEQRELRLQASRKMFVSILRSWPGLIHFFRSPNESSLQQNGIQTVIESLRMPYPEVRRHILDTLYQLLGLSLPPSDIADLDDALKYLQSSHGHQEHKQLYNGFVCSEAELILPQVSKFRLDLFENYLSLVLYSLIVYGLPEALITVVTKPKVESNSTRAAILLGHLLNLSSRLLPLEIAQKCHSLPTLVNIAASNQASFSERNLAAAAIAFLDKVKLIKKPGSGIMSLYLEHVIIYSQSSKSSIQYGSKSSEIILEKDSEDKFYNKLRDSLVFNRDPIDWDWDVIIHVISSATSAFKSLEEESHRKFFLKLIAYFKPSSQLYSKLDAGDTRGRLITTCGCKLFQFLISTEGSRLDECINVFLDDLIGALKTVSSTENPPVGAILSPTRLISTLSQYYFLFIGIISGTFRGRQLLEKHGFGPVLFQLISKCSEMNAKLIISSLDFSRQNSFSRPILLEALSCTNEGTKFYATNFLRVLLRARIDDFDEWLLEPLSSLINDQSVRVSSLAMAILDEACDDNSNLEALVKLDLDFSCLDDSGRLLLSRFAGCEAGYDRLVSKGCMAQELNYWIEVLCGKYVKMVEHALNESMTYHFKSIENSYGRRSERKGGNMKAAPLPPHLFGQLVKHDKGCCHLQDTAIVEQLVQTIKSGMQVIENELEIHKLKAALWSVGHIASSEKGLQLLRNSTIFTDIVSMTEHHAVLSIRGTSFYVLGLISSTPDMCTSLNDVGWLVAEFDRDELWPFSKKDELNSSDEPPHQIRGHSLSITSSVGTRAQDTLYRKPSRSLSPTIMPPHRNSTSSSPHQLTLNLVKVTPSEDNHADAADDEHVPSSSVDTESSFTILKSPSKLSPIISIDLLEPESRDGSRGVMRHLSVQTPESSYNDAHNFAIYVGIQRERVHSLGLTTVDSMIMHPTPSIADSYSSEDDDYDRNFFNPSASRNLGSVWTIGDTPLANESSSCWCKSYRGICLPSTLNLIFKAPEPFPPVKLHKPTSHEHEPDISMSDSGLDLHTATNCLACSGSKLMRTYQGQFLAHLLLIFNV